MKALLDNGLIVGIGDKILNEHGNWYIIDSFEVDKTMALLTTPDSPLTIGHLAVKDVKHKMSFIDGNGKECSTWNNEICYIYNPGERDPENRIYSGEISEQKLKNYPNLKWFMTKDDAIKYQSSLSDQNNTVKNKMNASHITMLTYHFKVLVDTILRLNNAIHDINHIIKHLENEPK